MKIKINSTELSIKDEGIKEYCFRGIFYSSSAKVRSADRFAPNAITKCWE